ncbi:MAG: hypothetical protein JWM68_4934 [Verrucomicrobiales bacterium]|nr:hypothetical protein [Verrucomicrobiales bacterium]
MRSDSIFNKVAGNRWFGIGLLAGAVALLLLVLLHLDQKLPPLPLLKESSEDSVLLAPVEKIEQLSSESAFLGIQTFTNGNHPFYTLHFQPPPAPPPPAPTPAPIPEPPKPPPTAPTKKVALLYQGVYETASGAKKAFLQVDGKLSILSPGAFVAADWTVGEIAVKKLTLTNRTAQTNVLEFGHTNIIEVPAQ